MRILHVTEASSAGVLTAVTTLAREQSRHADAGRPVLAYVPRPDSPDLSAIRDLTGEEVEVRQWRAGHRWRTVPLLRGLVRTLRKEQFDVIHLHSSRAGLLGRVVAALVGGRERVVYSPHCFSFERTDIDPLRRGLYLQLERAALRLGRNLLLVSDSEGRTARALLPGCRTAVVHNRVTVPPAGTPADSLSDSPSDSPSDPSSYSLSDSSSAPPSGEQTVIHIGRIASQKRPALFSEVAVLVAGEQEEVRFRWIGDGDRTALDPIVEVTGWLGQDQVRSEIARAQLVLFTSAGEGLPMALLEAQALGTPVVASPVAGVEDLVQHGRTGLLAETAADLARTVLALLADEGTRRRLARNATEQVRRDFAADRLGPDSLTAYQMLLTDKDTPS